MFRLGSTAFTAVRRVSSRVLLLGVRGVPPRAGHPPHPLPAAAPWLREVAWSAPPATTRRSRAPTLAAVQNKGDPPTRAKRVLDARAVQKRWHRHQDKHFEVQTGLTSLILSKQQVAPVFLHLRAQAWASQFAMLEMLSNAVLGDLLSRSISFLLAKYEKQETDGGRAGGTEARLRRLLLRSGNMVEEAERWLSSPNGPCSGSSGP